MADSNPPSSLSMAHLVGELALGTLHTEEGDGDQVDEDVGRNRHGIPQGIMDRDVCKGGYTNGWL